MCYTSSPLDHTLNPTLKYKLKNGLSKKEHLSSGSKNKQDSKSSWDGEQKNQKEERSLQYQEASVRREHGIFRELLSRIRTLHG